MLRYYVQLNMRYIFERGMAFELSSGEKWTFSVIFRLTFIDTCGRYR